MEYTEQTEDTDAETGRRSGLLAILHPPSFALRRNIRACHRLRNSYSIRISTCFVTGGRQAWSLQA